MASCANQWYCQTVHMSSSYQLLDTGRSAADAEVDVHADEQRARNMRRVILCAHCGARVSDASKRIHVNGSHQHTFFNPAGVVFQVVCFAAAPGCCGVGPFCEEFTWFAGCRWQIALCGSCYHHLGWNFEGDSSFSALIERNIHEADA